MTPAFLSQLTSNPDIWNKAKELKRIADQIGSEDEVAPDVYYEALKNAANEQAKQNHPHAHRSFVILDQACKALQAWHACLHLGALQSTDPKFQANAQELLKYFKQNPTDVHVQREFHACINKITSLEGANQAVEGNKILEEAMPKIEPVFNMPALFDYPFS